MTTTKERPILFSGQMVRALLSGQKTQTRRIWKMPRGLEWHKSGLRGGMETGYIQEPLGPCWGHVSEVRCPYGSPGDRLWVREAWRVCAEADAVPPRDMDASYRVWYEADAPHQLGFGKYRPPISMPRWASRITLEKTEVRVERLQGISEADAVAEGCGRLPLQDGHGAWWSADVDAGPALHGRTARDAYRLLWESINGSGSWVENPWVWVIAFKVIS